MVLNLDEAAQDKMNRNIQVSRSVVVIFPYVSLLLEDACSYGLSDGWGPIDTENNLM